MKALGFEEHGDIDRFKVFHAPQPQPGSGEVVVRLHSTALNHLDIWVCRGWPGLNLKLPHISGSDGAGIVETVGEGVDQFAPGDRVAIYPGINPFEDEFTRKGEPSVSPGYRILGENLPGTHAEFVAVPAKNLLPLPNSILFEDAAATGLVFLTAWRMLMHQANLKKGQTVLIIGAGGGVNSASIQLAIMLGCRVLATTSTEEKMQRAMTLGAHAVINYRQNPRWAEKVHQLTDKRGVDVVVDNVGQATLPDSLRAVARGGTIVMVGNTSGYRVQLDTRLIFSKQIRIVGSTMGSRDDYERVMGLLFEGKIRPVIHRVFPLEQGVEAIKIMERGEKFGKMVLHP